LKSAALLLALPAVLAGCLAGEPPESPVPTGQIDGAVLDHLLNPFGDQPVHLVQLDLVDRTSALGGFTFRGVPVGVYTLTTSRDGGQATSQIVEVRPGEVTRVILQLMPVPRDEPYVELHPFRSTGERPQAGMVCSSCEWAVPLGPDRPEEVTFTATWASSLLGPEHDNLDIQITDGRGFQLYDGIDRSSGLFVSIEGSDLHPEATELRITVDFGRDFLTPSQDFTMDSVLAFYHGANREEMFSVPS
jgi:hypothetical protein